MLTGKTAKGIISSAIVCTALSCALAAEAQDGGKTSAKNSTKQSTSADPSTLWQSMQQAGLTALAAGKLNEAEQQFRNAAVTARKISPDCKQYAQSLTGIGTVYERQGRYSNAQSDYELALESVRHNTTNNQLSVASAMTNVARTSGMRALSTEAESMFKEAINLEGSDNTVARAKTLNDYGHFLLSQGRYAEAQSVCADAMSTRTKLFGINSASVAECYNSTATIALFQGKHREAEDQLNGSLFISQKNCAENALLIAESSSILAKLHLDNGQIERAKNEAENALMIRQNVLGSEHPDNADAYFDLGIYQMMHQDLNQAEAYFHKSLRTRQGGLGVGHPQTATDMFALSLCLLSQGKSDQARYYYEQAVAARDKAFGQRDPITSAYKAMYIKHLWNTGHMLDSVNLKSREFPTFAKANSYLDIDGRCLQKCLQIPENSRQAYSWKDVIIVISVGMFPLILIGLMLTLPGVFLYLPKGTGITDIAREMFKNERPREIKTEKQVQPETNKKLALKAQKDSVPQWTKRN